MSSTQRTALHVAATLLFLLIIAPLQAQDYDPVYDPVWYSYSTTAQLSVAKRPSLQNQFILGFNWGQIPQDSMVFKALRMNILHCGLTISSDSSRDHNKALRQWIPSGLGLIQAVDNLSHNSATPYSWSTSMQFDPVVSNRGSAWEFNERLGDTTGATWGFKFRDLSVGELVPEHPNNTGLTNYSRMTFRDSVLQAINSLEGHTPTAPRLVLAQTSPDILQTQDNIDDFRARYASDVHHPDNLYTYSSSDMYIRDSRRGWYVFRFERYKRDSTGSLMTDGSGNPLIDTVAAGDKQIPWLDVAGRGGDTTVIHMKGDSTEWWLATNLRRLNNPAQTSLPPNTIVMSMKIPMVIRYDTLYFDKRAQRVKADTGTTRHTVYARFDSTCVAGDTISRPHYGLMDKTLAAYNDTVFYIRAGMLPPHDRTVNGVLRPDITLSAHFWLPRLANNSRYSGMQPEDIGNGGVLIPAPIQYSDTVTLRGYPRTEIMPVIVHVSMDVTYHGNVDIAVDWLRYETRMARMILRGYKDDAIIELGQLWYNHMDHMAAGRGLWMYGHYLMDECNPSYWRTQRYLNRLLENVGTTETGWNFRGQYRHQARDRQHWISWLGMFGEVPAPYIRYGKGNRASNSASATYLTRPDRSMNIWAGYKGIKYRGVTQPDTTYSYDYDGGRPEFDTTEQHFNGSWYEFSDSLYKYGLNEIKNKSVQGALEFGLDERVLNNRELLYGDLPVWYNSWTFSEWKLQPNTRNSDKAQYPQTAVWHFGRPHTGEEVRVVNWLALVLGGKGLMPYKGGSSFSSNKGEPIGQYGFTSYPSEDGSSGRLFPAGQTTGTNGGDFFDSLDVVWTYTNVDSVSWFTEVPKTRFYAGRTSTFDELVRVHSFADDNGDTLMRLRLQAVYSKGYRLTTSTRDSTVNMNAFLLLPVGGTYSAPPDTAHPGLPNLVRSIHTRTGSACASCFDHFRDSTFFMVTLLKDTAESMSDLFYVGVVNRRVDPTVYRTVAGGTHLGDSVRFFSTNEFNGLITNNQLNHYAYPQYAQHGSREITLPFNVSSSAGYTLLHIEEVGGTLDTVIGQKGNLAMMFKPGEGKLLRVQVLKPGSVADGRLSYNGQRKIVTQELPGDSLRYHMTYYKSNLISGRHSVFYRRSEPIARNSDEANIVWQPEIALTDSAYGLGLAYSKPDCAYPSIVVRYDSVAATDRVYVVFSCGKTENKGKPVADSIQHITESTFLANWPIDSLAAKQNKRARLLVRVEGDRLEKWGTPVINASAYGNFYAWADSLQGIGIGYKRPWDTTTFPYMYTRWGVAPDTAQHPSFSSYSRITSGENSAALVWQENNHIYYARPEFTSNLHLQTIAAPYSLFFGAPLNGARTIAKLSDDNCCSYNRMPVIYRAIETGSTYKFGGVDFPYTHERVFWEGRDSAAAIRSKIYRRALELLEAPGTYQILTGRALPTAAISGNIFRLVQPNVAQGKVKYQSSPTGVANVSDSAYTLNFSGGVGTQSALNNRIWHAPLSYGWRDGGQFATYALGSVTLVDNGQYPNLAARQELTSGNNWWENRRVLQQGTGITLKILSSAQYFYRTITPRNDDALTPMIGYKKSDGSCDKYLIADVHFDDSPLAFYEPVLDVRMHPDTAITVKDDTLKSEWFTIGSTREVSFFGWGTDTSFVKMDVVKRTTGTRTPIVLKPSAISTAATLIAQTFTNGNGDEYRLEFYRTTTTANAIEDLYVGQIPYDSLGVLRYGKQSEEASAYVVRGGIVNLAVSAASESAGLHAYVYPNPAQDVVSISVYRTYAENMPVIGNSSNERLLVRVVSMLGAEVARFNVSTGADISLPVKALPKGVYFVRVEQVGNPAESGTTSFVVE